MLLHWSLRDSKSPQVARTFLSTLAVLNNVVVWMVSTAPLISKSSNPFDNPLLTISKAAITIGIIVAFMLHSLFFYNSLARSRYLTFYSLSFSFFLWLAGRSKSTILQVLFFSLIIIRSGLLAKIRWTVCLSKSYRSLCVSFSKTDAGLCIYHLFVWLNSNSNFLRNFQWITLPIQPCLVLYSFCANLLHSLFISITT